MPLTRSHSELVARLDPIGRAVLLDRTRWVPDPDAPDVVDLGATSPGALAAMTGVARVTSVGAMASHADLPAVLRAVARALAGDGELFFAEPCAGPGWRALLRASLGARAPIAAGLHVHRDVPAAVRDAGFRMTDLQRFEVATAPVAVRSWVVARAMLRSATDVAEGDRPSEEVPV